MDDQINSGDKCVISRDIVIDGEIAFEKNEPIIVEKIHPNSQSPQHKYVVLSEKLQKRFQLSDADIAPQQVPSTIKRPVPEHLESKKVSPRYLWIVLGIMGTVVALLVIILFVLNQKSVTPREDVVKKAFNALLSGGMNNAKQYFYNEGAITQFEEHANEIPKDLKKDLKIQTRGDHPFKGYMVDWPGYVEHLGTEFNLITEDRNAMDKWLMGLNIGDATIKNIDGYEVRTVIYKEFNGTPLGDVEYCDLIEDSNSWKIIRSHLDPATPTLKQYWEKNPL